MKTIYGNFNQSGEGVPNLLKTFGDSFGSLGFFNVPGNNRRGSRGVYQIFTGDELVTGDNINKIVKASFGLGSPVRSYLVGVIDTMMIQLETFDKDGNPADVGADFSLELTLNAE